MATTTTLPRKMKIAVPTDSPLEAGDIICGACGQTMTRSVEMGPRAVEWIRYTCINPETGCKYYITRKVPVTNYNSSGIRD